MLSALPGVLESGKIGRDRDAAFLDDFLEVGLAKRQDARSAQCAQQNRADHAVIAFRRFLHVEQDHALRLATHEVHQTLRIRSTLSHSALFANGIRAMCGGDESSSLSSHQAALDCAASLGELGSNDTINVAGN